MTDTRVLIDTDPAIGVPLKDIDDGLAMLFLIASPEVSIEGFTINFGNVPADKGYAVAKEVLNVARADFPVLKGAKTKSDLGKRTSAVNFLIKTVRKNPKKITLLTLAPLTNVATAMMLDNKFANNLQNLVIMGGSLRFKPFSFLGEFNFHQDGKAASIVISSPVPKTLITMDVCSRVVFKEEHLERIKNYDSDVAKFLAKTIPPWLNKIKLATRKGGFYPWDVVAAAQLIDDTLFDKNPYTFKIQEKGIRRGRIYSIAKEKSFLSRDNIIPVNVPLNLATSKFMNLFINRLLKF